MLRAIYLISMIAIVFLLIACVAEVTEVMQRKHPGWKPQKYSASRRFHAWVTILFSIFCPIWNTFLVFVFIGNKDEMVQKAVEEIENTYDFGS